MKVLAQLVTWFFIAQGVLLLGSVVTGMYQRRMDRRARQREGADWVALMLALNELMDRADEYEAVTGQRPKFYIGDRDPS